MLSKLEACLVIGSLVYTAISCSIFSFCAGQESAEVEARVKYGRNDNVVNLSERKSSNP
jgi:hypothetical protein